MVSTRRTAALLVSLSSALVAGSSAPGQSLIRLEDVIAGGDGSGTAPPGNTGVDPSSGAFATHFADGSVFAHPSGLPQPVPESPYIDSVFVLKGSGPTAGDGCDRCYLQRITQSGVQLGLEDRQDWGSTWNYILKNRSGGVSTGGIIVGGTDIFTTAIGLHAAAGVTFDLDQLRARHGDAAVGCFSTFWGMDDCSIGTVQLMAMVSNDATGIIDIRQSSFAAGGGAVLQLPIPPPARYLTLISAPVPGANINCSHGTFARPLIQPAPCPEFFPSWLWSIRPSRVAPGGESVTVEGENLGRENSVRVGGQDLLHQVFASSRLRFGTTPVLSPGVYDVQLMRLGTPGHTLANAVEVVPPPSLVAITPSTVLLDRATPVTIRGDNLRADMTIFVRDLENDSNDLPLIDPQFVSETVITGSLPPVPTGQGPGVRLLLLLDQDRRREDWGAVTYVDSRLDSVEPATVSTDGGTDVTFFGHGLDAAAVFLLGGQPLTEVEILGPDRVRGRSPALPPGLHSAELADASGTAFTALSDAVTAETPPPAGPRITGVAPASIGVAGGEELVFNGEDLPPAFIPRLGGVPLASPEFLGPAAYRGFAPALPPGLHTADLWDGEGVVAVALADAVEVLEPSAPLPPPPVVIDADHAEGVARFNWINPVRYDFIHVRDRAGAFIHELGGAETTLVVPAPREGLELTFQGSRGGVTTKIVCAFAIPADCDIPAPLGGFANPGSFEFPLYGGNLPRNPARCAAGEGGGGGLTFHRAREWSGVNGFLQDSVSTGYSVDARHRTDIDPDLLTTRSYANRVVTGFTLESESDRLQIEAYYQKLSESPGLELKGRLVHVFPADGFEDELTFPDVPPGDGKKWHQLLYYRADRDPSQSGAAECKLPIPAGEYILQIYAVNGDPAQVHYSFADDDREREILIAGAPCPPYPLVRVRDLTGKTTLPNVHRITAETRDATHVEFRARGDWFDAEGAHSIDPADATYRCHNFEFVWEIQGARPPTPQSTGGSNAIVAEVFSLGCFWINLTITDKACGRSVFRRLQVLAEPKTFACNTGFYSVTQPVPDPRGISAIAGLNPPPGEGRMATPRPYSASVLVVPQDLCDGTGLAVPASAGDPEEFGDEDVEFRLAWFAGLGLIEAIPPQEIKVRDLCASAQNSTLRYFQIDIDDLGRARPLPPPLDTFTRDGKLAPVLLQSRTRVYRRRNAQGGVDVISVPPREQDWKALGGVMMMTNRPESLTRSHWQGSFSERDQSYSFFTRAAEEYQQRFDLDRSKSIPVGIVSGVNIPSFENDFSTGLNSPFRYVDGAWVVGNGLADNNGEILDNKLTAATLQIEGVKRDIDDATRYEWCKTKEIFSNVTEQTLFESIIFSGAIGPVPLTIWAKVGLALRFSITAHAGTVVSPFRGLAGGSFVESKLALESALDLAIPAAIRSDIAFGIIGINYKLLPHVESSFEAFIESRDLALARGLHLELAVQLDAQLQYCYFSFLESLVGDLTCIPSPLVPIIPRESLISEHIGPRSQFAGCPGGGGGAQPALAPADPGGAGGGVSDFTFDVEYYYPAVESSPDGRTEIEVVYQKSSLQGRPRTLVRARRDGVQQPLYAETVRDLEPAIGFLSNSRAIIAWTRSQPELAGLPAKSPEEYSLAELNLLRAQDEIVVTSLQADAGGSWSFDRDAAVISDPEAEAPNPASRRVDGRAAVAGDLSRETALVAWVRIDDPDYLKSEPGTTTYYRPEPPGSRNFVPVEAPAVRPHLERSEIYVRQLDMAGSLGPARKISTPGINVEPAIAFSPTGNEAYCVWVHDSVHVDLIGSNRGRNLVYAVHDAAADTWSEPRAIIADPDTAFPGLLEPSIALKADGTGILAFTALEAGSPERDTGALAANRLVYISRLEGGVFGPPVLIHGKCQKRVYGSKVRVKIPELGQDPFARVFKKPDIYVSWQQGGPPGTPESSGGLMVSLLDQVHSPPSAAIAVSVPGSVRSNVVAAVSSAGIRSVSFNSGPALRGRIGAGGGLVEPEYESHSTPLLPNLGIASCTLSNQFPGPGARVTAAVDIENIGFAASAAGDLGASEVRLRAIYVASDGGERVVADVAVPVIPAGGAASLELALEQPLDPVELRVELFPNPGDADAGNDSRACAFGAPAPLGLRCESIALTDEAATTAFQLTWSNAANYDEILLYRDGAHLASIPGACTVYVDRHAEPGSHTWEIRGRVDVSKSVRVATTCEPAEIESFRRGDVDGSGQENITDPVALLGFLFLGGIAPACPDAADADDSGVLNITDPIRILGYLFLGSAEPPAPGPVQCGSDPTPDGLGRCETECR